MRASKDLKKERKGKINKASSNFILYLYNIKILQKMQIFKESNFLYSKYSHELFANILKNLLNDIVPKLLVFLTLLDSINRVYHKNFDLF